MPTLSLSAENRSQKTGAWWVTSGPRQAKQAFEAIRALDFEDKTFVLRTGVIGGQERKAVLTSLLGSSGREDVAAARARIGDQFDWTITRGNYRDVIAAVKDEMKNLRENRPVKDERISQDAEQKRRAESNAAEAERQRKQEQESQIVEREMAKLRENYPAAEEYSERKPAARAAKNLKEELKSRWPHVDWKVRSEHYSGGDSVRVGWEFGPTDAEVSRVTRRYQHGHFDGMQDMYVNNTSPEQRAQSHVLGSAKYVFHGRSIPMEVREDVGKAIAKMEGMEVPEDGHLWKLPAPGANGSNKSIADLANETLSETSFGPGEVYDGVEPSPPEAPGIYRIKKRVDHSLEQPAAEADPDAGAGEGVIVRENKARGGVEIKFPGKPSAEVIQRVKSLGFRWSRRQKLWYAKVTPSRLEFAKSLQES